VPVAQRDGDIVEAYHRLLYVPTPRSASGPPRLGACGSPRHPPGLRQPA
jgi:hypothetical protein